MILTSDMSAGERNDLILRAVDKADLSKFHTRSDKECAVLESMIFIMNMLDEQSLANRILGAVRLTGIVKSLDYEETSKRFIVTFEAEQGTGEKKEETARTDRTDGPTGAIVRKKFTSDLIGHRCLIFKETTQSSTDPNKKVRLIPYIKIIG